ncbi:MAG: hypothetical protein JNM62_00565 [Flavobacteriales bacterium]|nr:hypothetical protein [Flavobacteriales bacterium]
MRRLLFPFAILMTLFSRAQVSTSLATGVFHSEVYVVNGSSWPVLITVAPKGKALALEGSQFILEAGKEMSIASYTDSLDFVSPVQKMTVTGTVTDRRGKPKTIGVLMMEKRRIDDHRHQWIYEVMPAGGRVGFGF